MNMQRLPSRESAKSSVSTMSDDSRPLQSQERGSFDAGERGENEDEEDSMLESYSLELESGSVNVNKLRKRKEASRFRKVVVGISIVALSLWILALIGYVAKGGYKRHTHALIAHDRRISYQDATQGRFSPRLQDVRWTRANGEDGMYLTHSDGEIRLKHVNGTERVLLHEEDVRAHQVKNAPILQFQKYFMSADMKYILLATDIRQNWRHSFSAKYWIYDIERATTTSLIESDVNRVISYAVWSPTGHSISFVYENDLFIRRDLGDVKRLTTDGSSTLFNGIPDWVYEEEIFQTNSAIWWAPDSTSLAYLRTEEEIVHSYPLEFFISHNQEPEQYPSVDELKYPKPGTPNPVVTLHYYDLMTETQQVIDVPNDFEPQEKLITEVKWLGSEKIFLRETNRDSVVQKTLIVEPRSAGHKKVKLTQELNVTSIDGGWFEVSRNTHYIPSNPKHGLEVDGYIDQVIHEGYLHLALFSPVDTKTPLMLTSGNWEVVEGAKSIDLENGLVYFLSTKRSGTERHLYSVSLKTKEIKAVTDDSMDGYYTASFSQQSGYYLLSYQGPDIPWQRIKSTFDPAFSLDIELNDPLRLQLTAYDLPTVVHSEIVIDGLRMNVKELRPPGFDNSGKTKYPVLFRPYNGPISQSVTKRFEVDWHTWLASDPTTEYIVVTLDGRGTGFMGRSLRTPVRGDLGHWEAMDQITVASMWKKKPYTNSEKFAIWGWSFGGFLTLKTLEQGPGVFQYGMAVAPVTDWRYYDSVYTERYMGTLPDNLAGYEKAAVSDVKAMQQANRFLIMHGTGDDNVHYQNTLSFVDKLNQANVDNYDMHIFPDSDHSIYFHNANRAVYQRLSDWLKHAFGVKRTDAEGLVDWRTLDWGTLPQPS